MTATRLPAGWRPKEWAERRAALGRLPRRVLVLLAAAWAWRVLPAFEARRPGDGRPRAAIRAAEAWALNPDSAAAAAAADAAAAAAAAYAAFPSSAAATAYAAYAAAYARAAAAAAAAADAAYAAAYAARAAARAARDASDYAYLAALAALAARDASDAGAGWDWLCATYRHAVGPAGAAFDPAWRTETAVAIARGIVAGRDCGAMPILADALQDAGCDNEELLHHLRHDVDEWTLADWALTHLLGHAD